MKLQIAILSLLAATQAWSQTPDLIFRSGFEPDVVDTTNGAASDLFGIDNSVSPPNDWVLDLDNHPNIGAFDIQYQGGSSDIRMAEIVPDPTDPLNRVLEFWIKRPNVEGIKGRVQANLYGNNGISELFYSIRMYLPTDFDTLKYVPGEIEWLTLMEFWNNPGWKQDFGFRVTVDLQKIGTAPDSLRLGVHGQTYDVPNDLWTDVWNTTNESFVVPIARWMTLRIRYLEGDDSTGKFHLSVTPEGDPETVVFDITNYTHHPLDPAPDGLTHLNPFKLYTSADIINGLTDSGRLLHLYWDDFALWKNPEPAATAPPDSPFGDFRIYPNPSSGQAILEFDNPARESHALKLYDVQGRVIKTIADITADEVVIEKGDLGSGLYFFRLYRDGMVKARGELILR